MNRSTSLLFPRRQRIRQAMGLMFFAVALVVFLVKAKAGLHLFEFTDETEKFVAAQMISHGKHLYRDIFAHHGPLSYIIAHGYTALISKSNFNYIRIFQVCLTLLASFSLFCTPALKTMTARSTAAGTYLLLLSSLWVVQGLHMILYQQIGGILLTVSFLHTPSSPSLPMIHPKDTGC